MIWFYFLLWALVILLGLWRVGAFTKGTLQFLGTALLVAAAGYAWQGRPMLAGSPAKGAESRTYPDSAFAALRGEFFDRFDSASHWLIIADSYQRRGDTRDAAGVIRSALRGHPDSVPLWIGLGNALVLHADGMMTPAAELAYRRAAALAPAHPAARFFYGLSLIQSGQVDAGEKVWRDLLASAPADAKWRPIVADRLAILEKLRAMQAQGPRQAGE
jgi:cytochrome c-type biogenesis protein CcmH/NrfG